MKEIFFYDNFDFIKTITTGVGMFKTLWQNIVDLNTLNNMISQMYEIHKNEFYYYVLIFNFDATNFFYYALINSLVYLYLAIFVVANYTATLFLTVFYSWVTQNISFFMIFFGITFFLSTIFSFVFISYLGLYGVFKLNIITLFFFWMSVLLSFNDFILNNTCILFKIGRWFYIFHNYPVFLEFFLDPLSLSYMVLTLTISYFVQLYTFAYFRYEPLVDRLILFLNCFILSMIFFVSSANLVLLFLGWELIGLTSFVLINFWVTRKATLKAAFKAFVFNKISDIFFFIFIILILFIFNSVDIITIIKQSYLLEHMYFYILGFEIKLVEILTFFLMGAAFIKSAQLGFHLWLPDSMEAPVPASALIHSATLVSAGLFLLLRFNTLFELTNYVIFLIAIISALTSLYGGLGAMFQSDVKRILAYSTISHCGFLIVSFFFFSTEITIFYLYVHGFFKAGVFLCVGNVIRFSNNNQDFKRMGGFFKYLPSDCFFIGIGLFNLGGLPFSVGFYMKHALIIILQQNSFFNSLILTVCLFGALTGLFYSYRLVEHVFFDFRKAKKYIYFRYNRIAVYKQHQYFLINSKNAIFAIKYLFICAYVICFLYYLNMKSSLLYFDSFLFSNSNFFDLVVDNVNFLWNLVFLNWLILGLFCFIIYSIWRTTPFYLKIYNNFFCSILFSAFFIFFI